MDNEVNIRHMNTKPKHSTIEMTKPITIMTRKVKITPNIKYELCQLI